MMSTKTLTAADVADAIRDTAAKMADDRFVEDRWDAAYVRAYRAIVVFPLTARCTTFGVGVPAALVEADSEVRIVASQALTSVIDAALDGQFLDTAHIFTADDGASALLRLVCDCGNH